jgi:hypothetical protein
MIFLASCNKQTEREIYQLKIYSISGADQETRMDEYLEDAYIPALKRAGIPDVGVFKPVGSSELSREKIFLLIPFHSMEQMEGLQDLLAHDTQYLDEGRDYIDAGHEDPPFERIQMILLRAFSGFPHYAVPLHGSPHPERIYELRSYHGPTEKHYEDKVEMFNDAGEIQLFIDLGFQPVFFGEVISGPSMPNLMYMTTFADTISQQEHWNAFRESPEWNEMKEIEKYKHTVSHIDKYLLHPAEYSGI